MNDPLPVGPPGIQISPPTEKAKVERATDDIFGKLEEEMLMIPDDHICSVKLTDNAVTFITDYITLRIGYVNFSCRTVPTLQVPTQKVGNCSALEKTVTDTRLPAPTSRNS